MHPDAVIGPGTRIGEFCVIESDTTIGAHCVLEPYVYIKRWTTLGDANEISAGTVLGTDPLDKSFGGARSYLRIGDRNKIREHYHDLARHAAGIGNAHRERQLHHDVRAYRAQLPARETILSWQAAPWWRVTSKSKIKRLFRAASSFINTAGSAAWR